MLGNGAACLVFTSVTADLSLDHQYYDFTGKVKPHLLNKIDNNMGAETEIHYSPSTKFYLQDEKADKPWITHLPFPVQVVAKIVTRDLIGGSTLVAAYEYHHGYFDPVEREFRGFGRVDRTDAETFEHFSKTSDGNVSSGANDRSPHVPPVLTKTWYHTGACDDAGNISRQFAGEYYQDDKQAHPLPGTVLDPEFQDINPENMIEAFRALHGQTLREEVYGLDEEPNAERAKHPYVVTESNFYVRLIQPKAGHKDAVCFVHPRETISYHYERNPADPRVSHALTLEVDKFGNVLKQVAIGYGRRQPDATLPTQEDRAKQTQTLITYTENSLTEAIDNNVATYRDDYLTPLPCETCTYELTGFKPANSGERFSFDEWTRNSSALLSSAERIPYEQTADDAKSQKRLIEHVRTLYRRDDCSGPLPLGQLESLAIPFESYKLAFTPGLLAQVFKRKDEPLLPDPASVLGGQGADRGGYLQSQALKADRRFPPTDPDGHWWIPSGRVFMSPSSDHTAEQEREYAEKHFYLPCRTRDPFHTESISTESFVIYDAYDLLVLETRDALGNRVTVGERDADGNIDRINSGNDYRVMQPWLVTDPNGNRAAVAYDALGMVVATAVMGKKGETLGDLLDGVEVVRWPSELSNRFVTMEESDLQAFIADPHSRAAALLGKATTRIVYDLDRYQRAGQPPFAATLARETHASDPDGAQTKIQISFSYSDGFGREIQKKTQAEAGDAPQRQPPFALSTGDIRPGDLMRDHRELVQAHAPHRWVGTGRIVFNNKGKPAKQYEPFFSSTHLYEAESEMTDTGVTSILFYDALERLVATLHPNHTFDKVVFDPWRQESWDANDTVLVTDPMDDPHVGKFFSRLPKPDFLPTWYERRHNGQQGTDENAAANKPAAHANTPTVAYFDTLGRPFLTLADNGLDPSQPPKHLLFATRTTLDIEGNHRELIDANGRIAMRYDYDMLGNRIHEVSMDAGERWMLNDVDGKPLYAWDSRDHIFRTAYDQLRRPTGSFLQENGGAELRVGRTVYGETHSDPETSNLRGRVFQLFDQAGVVTSDAYDFKGNLLRSQRQLAQEYKTTLDWLTDVPLETEPYTSSTRRE